MEFDHYTNLRRWSHVFGRERILCVRDTALHSSSSRKQTIAKISAFLALDPSRWSKRVLASHSITHHATMNKNDMSFRPTTMHRLMSDQMGSFNETLESIEHSVENVRKAFSNILTAQKVEWINDFCAFSA